jgi:hypothetical protein
MRVIENWIDEENLKPVIEALGWVCGYQFGPEDWDGLQPKLKDVDEECEKWTTVVLKGDFAVEVDISMMSGSTNYSLRIRSDKDLSDVCKVVLGLAQCYRMVDF